MEAIELKELIEAHNRKLDQLISLNREAIFTNVRIRKSQRDINRLRLYRIGEVVFNIILVLLLGSFIANHWGDQHLVISGIIVGVFVIVALVGSVGQVVLLQQIDYLKPVVVVKKHIQLVNAHGFLLLKLMFLAVSVWWAFAIVGLEFFIGFDLYPHLDPDFVTRYVIGNGILLFPLLWVANKLSYNNLHIPWVRKTIEGLTTSRLNKALESLKAIEEFER